MTMTHLPSAKPGYIALAGPTAAGKTAAALAIARQHAVEIISVDSALVYRGMDIGTAKPDAAELAAVPHHLINIREPQQAYSAAEFVLDAKRLMNEIRRRGKLPLLAGGTMLYFKALFDGLDPMPTAHPALRAEIASQAQAQGWPALHAELARVDPVSAARLQAQDSQRISRALEVFRASGQPLSFFQRRIAGADAAPQTGDPECLLISLEPDNRAWLHERIAQRFDAMLAAGFLDEVRQLRAQSALHPDLPSMRCVGYRQAWKLLDSLQALQTSADGARGAAVRQAEHDFREQGIAATRQLAKRQLTWLRSMPQRRAVACDAPDALARVLALAAKGVST
jgi:tRNA dimethylallyltransferase